MSKSVRDMVVAKEKNITNNLNVKTRVILLKLLEF